MTMISSQSRTVDSRAGVNDCFHHLLFHEWIECTGGLVENEDSWVQHHDSRDLNSLTLTPGQIPPAVGHDGVVSAGASFDLIVNARCLCRCANIGVSNAVIEQRDVVADASGEQHDVLIDVADPPREKPWRSITQDHTVGDDFTLGRRQKSDRYPRGRRLAAARCAAECDSAARFNDQGQIRDGSR